MDQGNGSNGTAVEVRDMKTGVPYVFPGRKHPVIKVADAIYSARKRDGVWKPNPLQGVTSVRQVVQAGVMLTPHREDKA